MFACDIKKKGDGNLATALLAAAALFEETSFLWWEKRLFFFFYTTCLFPFNLSYSTGTCSRLHVAITLSWRKLIDGAQNFGLAIKTIFYYVAVLPQFWFYRIICTAPYVFTASIAVYECKTCCCCSSCCYCPCF